MDQHITVTSGQQNPCDFVSNFTDAININQGYEVAVMKIFHGPLNNITSRNNTFALEINNETIRTFAIPEGFYESTCGIAKSIYDTIPKNIGDGSSAVWKYNAHGDGSIIKLPKYVTFYSGKNGEYLELLKLFGYCKDDIRFDKLEFSDMRLDNAAQVGFLYSNIVPNSLVNQKQSRILGIFYIKSKKGYNCSEVMNTSFLPLSVHSFTDIDFLITNVHGEVLEINALEDGKVTYPTIIVLRIKPIYRP